MQEDTEIKKRKGEREREREITRGSGAVMSETIK